MSKRSDRAARRSVIAYLIGRRAEHIVAGLVPVTTDLTEAHNKLVHFARLGVVSRLTDMVANCDSIERAQAIIDSFNP